MFLVTGIRNMVVDMFPSRLGELGYIGLLNKGYGVKLEHCTSSLAISIAYDLIALFIVVLLVVLKQAIGSEVAPWALAAVASALLLSVIAVFALFFFLPQFAYWLRNRASPKKGNWFARLLDLGQRFADSLLAVRNAGRIPQILGLSVVIRVLKYSSFYLLFMAVAQPSFPDLAQLPVEQVVTALIGGELGASLPIPTFMSFGSYEAGTALVFQILGVADQAGALINMLCVHIWSQLVDYTIGGLFLLLFIWLLRSKKQNTRPVGWKTWASVAACGVAVIIGTGFLAWELRAAKKLGSFTAPEAGEVASNVDEWRDNSKAFVRQLDGFAVFSSNRDGNHDIFKLDFADFSLSKLTAHPHTETYARISPNGGRLVFSRSHKPWVSQRNTVSWDVYLLDMQTNKEKLLATNATSGQWLNNREITVLQKEIA